MSILALDRVAVVAHRGAAKLRPENTHAAFDHAASLGVDGFECDVHLSRDDEVVIIHDAALDRTTSGRGPVADRTAGELAALGVPRLAELLDRHPHMPVIVEIKGDRLDTVRRAIAVIRHAHAEARVVLAGFSDAVLQEARRLAPEMATSASSREARSAAFRSRLWMRPTLTGYRVLQVPLRLAGREVLTRGFVRAARRAGIPVHAWIIDDPSDMRRLIGWGVTGLITDRPDLALPIVAEASPPMPLAARAT